MLYSKKDLDFAKKDRNKFEEVSTRYFHKFYNDSKNLKKLKPHELDFLFSHISLLKEEPQNINPKLKTLFPSTSEYFKYLDVKGLSTYRFNLYEIKEAHDFLFYKLILIYYDNLYYQQISFDNLGKISKQQISIDKKFMDSKRSEWIKLLNDKKGTYLPHVFDEYSRKKKLLEKLLNEGKITAIKYTYKIHQLDLISFHLYYFVRLWFGEKQKKYHEFAICGLNFIFDSYSYIHIMSRHYMESINNYDFERSFNEELPFIDIRDLPISIEKIIREYSFCKTIYLTDEYLILEAYEAQYILWYSYRLLPQLGFDENVMHVRTFYKIKESRDFNKIIGRKKHRISNDVCFFI